MKEYKEIWLPIQGFEGYYEVSNYGKVRTVERIVAFGNQHRTVKVHELKPKDNGHGYMMVNLNMEGKQYYRYIHRLVAQAFIPNPENKEQVDHISGDKTDNAVDNLRWVTPEENMSNPVTVSKVVRTTDEEKAEWRRNYAAREDVRERDCTRAKERRKANPELYRERDRLNYLKHREHRLAYQKEYAKRHKSVSTPQQ